MKQINAFQDVVVPKDGKSCLDDYLLIAINAMDFPVAFSDGFVGSTGTALCALVEIQHAADSSLQP